MDSYNICNKITDFVRQLDLPENCVIVIGVDDAQHTFSAISTNRQGYDWSRLYATAAHVTAHIDAKARGVKNEYF